LKPVDRLGRVYLPGDRIEVLKQDRRWKRRSGRYNPMLTVVPDGCLGDQGGKDASPSLIDEIVREGARRMLAEALRAEVGAYIARSRPGTCRTWITSTSGPTGST
jgi:hypothetical protein